MSDLTAEENSKLIVYISSEHGKEAIKEISKVESRNYMESTVRKFFDRETEAEEGDPGPEEIQISKFLDMIQSSNDLGDDSETEQALLGQLDYLNPIEDEAHTGVVDFFESSERKAVLEKSAKALKASGKPKSANVLLKLCAGFDFEEAFRTNLQKINGLRLLLDEKYNVITLEKAVQLIFTVVGDSKNEQLPADVVEVALRLLNFLDNYAVRCYQGEERFCEDLPSWTLDNTFSEAVSMYTFLRVLDWGRDSGKATYVVQSAFEDDKVHADAFRDRLSGVGVLDLFAALKRFKYGEDMTPENENSVPQKVNLSKFLEEYPCIEKALKFENFNTVGNLILWREKKLGNEEPSKCALLTTHNGWETRKKFIQALKTLGTPKLFSSAVEYLEILDDENRRSLFKVAGLNSTKAKEQSGKEIVKILLAFGPSGSTQFKEMYNSMTDSDREAVLELANNWVNGISPMDCVKAGQIYGSLFDESNENCNILRSLALQNFFVTIALLKFNLDCGSFSKILSDHTWQTFRSTEYNQIDGHSGLGSCHFLRMLDDLQLLEKFSSLPEGKSILNFITTYKRKDA